MIAGQMMKMAEEAIANGTSRACFHCGHPEEYHKSQAKHRLDMAKRGHALVFGVVTDSDDCTLCLMTDGGCPGWQFLDSCLPAPPTAEQIYEQLQYQANPPESGAWQVS